MPLIEEATETTVSGVDYNSYITHDPSGLPVLLTEGTTTDLYAYDARTNPVALINDNAATDVTYSYDPYGNSTVTYDSGHGVSGFNPYSYGDGVPDITTGLVKFGQRWYEPTTGTWTQEDQINQPLNPDMANRYEYAGDDPVNSSDPTGYDFWSGVGEIFAGMGLLELGGMIEEGAAASIVTGCIFCGVVLGVFGAGVTGAGVYSVISGVNDLDD